MLFILRQQVAIVASAALVATWLVVVITVEPSFELRCCFTSFMAAVTVIERMAIITIAAVVNGIITD